MFSLQVNKLVKMSMFHMGVPGLESWLSFWSQLSAEADPEANMTAQETVPAICERHGLGSQLLSWAGPCLDTVGIWKVLADRSTQLFAVPLK